MIQRIYNKLNENWIYPLIVMFSGFLITYFLLQIPREIAYNSSIIIFFISIAILIIFGIITIFKKDYLKGILQTLSTLIFGGFALFFLSFILMFYPYDFFADNLKIPENINFEKPIGLNENQKYNNIRFDKPNFILFDGMQGGMYKYKLFLSTTEKGIAYLKIYEITKNEILSEDDIKKRSEIIVYNPTNEIKEFELKDDFFVYEGNWDQFYGSRVEVWFKPQNKLEKELRIINNHEFLFVVEKPRENSIHSCSINDIQKILEQIPTENYGDLKFIILRQPKRKEEIISPVWGRLIYSFEFEGEYFPAIIIDAIDLNKKIFWSKKQTIDDQKEFERLKDDGHKFLETKREYIANFEPEFVRNTQLYRTLPHEFGHYVHYLEIVENQGIENEDYEEKEKRMDFYFNLPKLEKEKFAHNFAEKFKNKLILNKIIPFQPT